MLGFAFVPVPIISLVIDAVTPVGRPSASRGPYCGLLMTDSESAELLPLRDPLAWLARMVGPLGSRAGNDSCQLPGLTFGSGDPVLIGMVGWSEIGSPRQRR